MNNVVLKGTIRNIQISHMIGNVEYYQADMVVPKDNNIEDVIQIKFKKFSNQYKDGDYVELTGNLRSFSQKLENGKNKVNLYVFTYLDTPEKDEEDTLPANLVEIDGRICKLEELRQTLSGKQNLHFILANNIINSDGSSKLNNYIPTVVFGKLATEMSQKLKVSDQVKIKGQVHSRTYKKTLEDGSLELRVAHELVVTDMEIL